jgi:predicted CopG family antitoxin
VPESAPAQRRRQAIRLLQQISEEIGDAYSDHQAILDNHRNVGRQLASVVGSEIVGPVFAPMLAGSVEWTDEAYVELERILKNTIESFTSAHTKNLNRARRNDRRIGTLRAQITRLEKSQAEIIRQVESKASELATAQARLGSLRAELFEREQSLLSFLKRKDALRLEINHLAAAESQLKLELGSLERQRNLIEQDKVGTDRAGDIKVLDDDLEALTLERAQLEQQIARFESETSRFLTAPYMEQMVAIRKDFESSKKRLTAAIRRERVLATRRYEHQSFDDWIAECDKRRSSVITLVNTATKNLSEADAKLQARIVGSVMKTKEREIERKRKATERRQARLEAWEAERRAQAEARMRAAAEQRQQEAATRPRALRNTRLRPGEPDLNELRRRFRRS